MTDWPRVTILLLTYEDGQRHTAERTLRAALDGITYSGELAVHIADDGSVEGHREALHELAGGYQQVVSAVVTNANRRGYGHSYNLATQEVHGHSGCVLVLEDDWELTVPLDLDPLVETLLHGTDSAEHHVVGCIRLGYLGFTQRLLGEVAHTPAGPMLLLDWKSSEPHVAAGHPRLETVDWERNVGPWAEGLAPGATEFDWCHRPAARVGVAWPLNYGPASQQANSLFVHTGAHGLGEVAPEA